MSQDAQRSVLEQHLEDAARLAGADTAKKYVPWVLGGLAVLAVGITAALVIRSRKKK